MGAAEALGGARQNSLDHSIGVFAHVAIPDAENCPTFTSQPLVSDCVPRRFSVLSAVDLHDELRLSAREVHNVWPDWQLARELRSIAGQ